MNKRINYNLSPTSSDENEENRKPLPKEPSDKLKHRITSSNPHQMHQTKLTDFFITSIIPNKRKRKRDAGAITSMKSRARLKTLSTNTKAANKSTKPQNPSMFRYYYAHKFKKLRCNKSKTLCRSLRIKSIKGEFINQNVKLKSKKLRRLISRKKLKRWRRRGKPRLVNSLAVTCTDIGCLSSDVLPSHDDQDHKKSLNYDSHSDTQNNKHSNNSSSNNNIQDLASYEEYYSNEIAIDSRTDSSYDKNINDENNDIQINASYDELNNSVGELVKSGLDAMENNLVKSRRSNTQHNKYSNNSSQNHASYEEHNSEEFDIDSQNDSAYDKHINEDNDSQIDAFYDEYSNSVDDDSQSNEELLRFGLDVLEDGLVTSRRNKYPSYGGWRNYDELVDSDDSMQECDDNDIPAYDLTNLDFINHLSFINNNILHEDNNSTISANKQSHYSSSNAIPNHMSEPASLLSSCNQVNNTNFPLLSYPPKNTCNSGSHGNISHRSKSKLAVTPLIDTSILTDSPLHYSIQSPSKTTEHSHHNEKFVQPHSTGIDILTDQTSSVSSSSTVISLLNEVPPLSELTDSMEESLEKNILNMNQSDASATTLLSSSAKRHYHSPSYHSNSRRPMFANKTYVRSEICYVNSVVIPSSVIINEANETCNPVAAANQLQQVVKPASTDTLLTFPPIEVTNKEEPLSIANSKQPKTPISKSKICIYHVASIFKIEGFPTCNNNCNFIHRHISKEDVKPLLSRLGNMSLSLVSRKVKAELTKSLSTVK